MRSIEVSDPRQAALNQISNAVEAAWFGGVGTQYGTTINGQSVSIFNSRDGCRNSSTLEVKVNGKTVAGATSLHNAEAILANLPGLVPAVVEDDEPAAPARC